MKKFLRIWLVPAVLAAAVLVSCDKLREFIEYGQYAEWATSYYFGNSLGDISTFTLDIEQGYTWDSETLNYGTEVHLVLKAPPVEGIEIPSGQYTVSDDPGQLFTVQKDRLMILDSSYIGYLDKGETEMRRYVIESGRVRIDQHEDGYTVKLRVVADGREYTLDYDGYVWAVDCVN